MLFLVAAGLPGFKRFGAGGGIEADMAEGGEVGSLGWQSPEAGEGGAVMMIAGTAGWGTMRFEVDRAASMSAWDGVGDERPDDVGERSAESRAGMLLARRDAEAFLVLPTMVERWGEVEKERDRSWV